MSLAYESPTTQWSPAILVVGGPASLSGIGREELAELPARVDLAGSFSEARERLERWPYSLVVCSQPPASTTGSELLDHLASTQPGVPCVFSARPMDVLRFG